MLVVAAASLPLLGFPKASASESALGLQRGTDIVQQWKPDQRLYIRGRLGVSESRLNDLERWLDVNAPNWTILLLENARGETYRDDDGRSYSGMDAVEYAVGKGLANKTGYGDLVDERTGQKNGAAFVLFLRERKFSYSGSEVHDVRRLGAANWSGRLDRAAFRAMSNGGRIVDAVRNTVRDIDARLTRQLALEQQERQRALARVRLEKENAERAIAVAKGELLAVRAEVEVLAAKFPGHSGDLLQPDFDSLGRVLDGGTALLEAGDASEAAKAAARVTEWIKGQRRLMMAFVDAPRTFAELHAEIAELNPTGEGWGADRLEIATAELSKAQDAHARGDSNYMQFFENAQEAVDAAHEEIIRSREALRKKIERQKEVDREARIRTRQMRNLAFLVGTIAFFLVVAMAIYLNRRRTKWKREAEDLLASWERGFRQKTDALFELLDRTAVVVGSSADLSKRGYSGETLALSRKTIKDVDELFIMSSAVERVLAEARDEIHPKYGYLRFVNLFASRRYHRAMKLLRDEPIRFAPEEGIELIVRDDATEHRKLLGNLETYTAFALSFNELIAEFNDRASRAVASLDTIENSWAEINGALEDGQKKLTTAAQVGIELSAKSEQDGWFVVPDYAATWMPAAEAEFERAIEMAGGDPVQALRDPVAVTRRMAGEMSKLCETIETVRETLFPKMRENVAALEEAGHLGGWVDVQLSRHSEEANALCGEGAEASVADGIAELDEALAALSSRVEKACALACRLRETADRKLDAVEETVATTRSTIASERGLKPRKVLAEKGLNPDTRIVDGRAQFRSARAEIDRGAVDEAEDALEAVDWLVDEALALVAATRKSHEEHADTVAARSKRAAELDDGVRKHGELLQKLQTRYAESALCLDATEFAEGSESSSVSEHVTLASNALAESRRLVDNAEEAAASARLIEAAEVLVQAANAQNRCATLFSELREQDRRLAETESRNDQRFEELGQEEVSVQSVVRDSRVMRPTITASEAASLSFSRARESLGVTLNDPFDIARQLIAVDSAFDDVRQQAASDTRMFDEARRSVHALETHVATAHQLAHRAATDEIPDSERLLELQETVEQLKLALAKAEKILRKPHKDWKALDVEADRIGGIAGRTVAEMRGELRDAQAAVSLVSSAAGLVRDATGWKGDYGVRISGSPGAEHLHDARNALMRGMYLETQRHARDAAESARHAIRKAQRLVANRRAAALRAAEERRRAERARKRRMRSSSSSSGWSFGGGGGGGGGGGSFGGGGGGMSRSSFSSSSGSGMSRSGW